MRRAIILSPRKAPPAREDRVKARAQLLRSLARSRENRARSRRDFGERTMKCVACGGDVHEAVRNLEARRALLNCPHCDASLLCQVVDFLPDGSPVMELRLWGHPQSTRRIRRVTPTTG